MAAWNRKVDAGYITMEFDPPLERIQEDLNEIDRDLSNMRTPLRESVQKVIIPSINANFEAGGRPAWQPLAGSTLEKRARHGTGSQILVETGRLRTAATQFSRWDIGTQEAKISNWPGRELVKAAVHNFGAVATGRTGTANIPARPFLMIQDRDEDDVEEIFLDWMERRARSIWTRRS